MKFPFAAPAFIIMLTLFGHLVLSLVAEKLWKKISTFWITLGLFSALSASIASKSTDVVAGILNPNRIDQILVTVLLLFFFVSFITKQFAKLKKSDEFSLCMLIFLFLGLLLLQSRNILVFAFVGPFIFLVLSAVPALNNKLIGIRSLTKGVVYSVLSAVLISGVCFYFYQAAGSYEFAAIQRHFLDANDPALFFPWVIGLFVIASWALAFPVKLFDLEFEASSDWLDVLFYRWGVLLLFALMVFKWTLSLCVWVGQDGAWEWRYFMGVSYSELLFYFSSFVLMLSLVQIVREKTLLGIFTGLLMLPILFATLAIVAEENSGFPWAILSLLVFIFASNTLVAGFCLLKSSLSTHLHGSRILADWSGAHRGPVLLVVISLIFPFSNMTGMNLIKNSYLYWSTRYPELAVLFIAGGASFLMIYLTINAMRNSFIHATEMIPERSLPNATLWNYILLIPLIILGIYPIPLYNYVKFALASF